MTGYELIARLKKARKRFVLTATEQALYHELGMQANEVEWDDIFSCSNSELCVALSISENTLVSARQSLIQCGLIFYRSGKSKRKFGDYSFETKLTTSNCEVDTGGNASANAGGNPGGNASANAADYNKHKPNSKPNQHSEGKPSGAASSSGKKNKKKNSEDDEATEYWQAFVKIWFDFNQEHLKIVPSFKGSDPRDLKGIVEILKKRAIGKKFEWSEQHAKDTLVTFLQYSYNDEWLKGHFLLSNLLKQFDKIITPNNGNGNSKSVAPDYSDHKAELLRKMGGATG